MALLTLAAVAALAAAPAGPGGAPAVAPAGASGAGARDQEAAPDWPAVWAELDRAAALPADAPGRAGRLDALAALARERRDTARGRLLAAAVERARGAEARALELPPPSGAWPLDPEESWRAAALHAPSPLRARAVLEALAATPGAPSPERLRLAWEVGVEEAAALRLEGALAIQEELLARSPAVWSAMDLALTAARLGEPERADRVLATRIAAEREAGRATAELWARRGLVALGAGDERRARDYLGRGCARGSADACVILARLDLERGRTDAARAGFRALLLDDDPSPWALRGWGVALLPPR